MSYTNYECRILIGYQRGLQNWYRHLYKVIYTWGLVFEKEIRDKPLFEDFPLDLVLQVKQRSNC